MLRSISKISRMSMGSGMRFAAGAKSKLTSNARLAVRVGTAAALAGAVSAASIGYSGATKCKDEGQPFSAKLTEDMRPPSTTPSRPTAGQRIAAFLRGKRTEDALSELDEKEREASTYTRRVVFDACKSAFDAVAQSSDGEPLDPDDMMAPERFFVAELGWRLARAAIQLTQEDRRMMADERQRLLELAERTAATSVMLNGENASARRFYGIAMNSTGEFSTTSDYIAKSFRVRDQWLKAAELNPEDPNARHLLGRWCYDVANMSSFTRNIAAMIFRTPPSSTFEDALKNFKAAEDLRPGFWKSNVLYLGMCHYQLGHTDQAKKWIRKALKMPNQTADDEAAHKEALSWKSWLGM